ncbi:protein phosphatase 1 regulatory subunit 3G [Menidia menidia]
MFRPAEDCRTRHAAENGLPHAAEEAEDPDEDLDQVLGDPDEDLEQIKDLENLEEVLGDLGDPDEDPEDPDEVLGEAEDLALLCRVRVRAASLPAALPDGRKRVTFADSMGLTLTRVKTFRAQEEPRVPRQVLSRHRSFPPPHAHAQEPRAAGLRELPDAERRVRALRVCLEALAVTPRAVHGHVRVLAGSVEEVGVRCSFDGWRSHVDAHAERVAAQPPGLVGQRYAFAVHAPPCTDAGAAHFAVYARGREGEFWDNNGGRNYTHADARDT